MPDLMTWHALEKASSPSSDWTSFDHQLIDPYLMWADLTSFGGAALDASPVDRKKASLQVALELHLAEEPGPRWPDLGVSYAQAAQQGNLGYATAEVAVVELPRLLSHSSVNRLELGFVNTGPAAKLYLKGDAPPPVEGPVVAVIDFGCAFAHERFRHRVDDRWRTRIAYLWDQGDDAAQRHPADPWQPVHGQRRGRELNAAAIDRLLATHQADGRVDEDEVYRAAHYDDVTPRLTHGTHVLDLAAGAAPDSAIEREPKIIFVQLPAQAVEDTSGGSMVTCVIDALRYILARTRPGDPLVVNLSYGSMAGPHDGSTLLESAMDAVIAETLPPDGTSEHRRYLAIVLPAGNNFESDGHARLTLSSRQRSRTLHWQVQPDDSTDTFLELWYDKSHAGSIEVLVTPPGGQPCKVPVDQAAVLRSSEGLPPVAAVIHRRNVASGLNDAMALIALAPTAEPAGAAPLAPAGVWQVELRLTPGAPAVDVFAWIERDDPAIGSQGSPRQSTFVPTHARLPRNAGSPKGSLVQRRTTCNSIANGEFTVVVGGCVGRGVAFELARYSSAGPPRRRGPAREWPDLVAMSEESPALFGVLAAGTRSGIRARMNGTSVAAPQVARALIQSFFPALGVLAAGRTTVPRPSSRQGPVAAAQAWTRTPNADLILDTPTAPAGPAHRVGRGRLSR